MFPNLKTSETISSRTFCSKIYHLSDSELLEYTETKIEVVADVDIERALVEYYNVQPIDDEEKKVAAPEVEKNLMTVN